MKSKSSPSTVEARPGVNEIVLDTRIFRPVDNATVAVHVVCGRIRYDEGHLRRLGWTTVNGRQALGRLVWIKPIVLPTDSGDVRQYKLENKDFPQQTTADQWYDESQFESYRKLGELSGRAAFCPATLAEAVTLLNEGATTPGGR